MHGAQAHAMHCKVHEMVHMHGMVYIYKHMPCMAWCTTWCTAMCTCTTVRDKSQENDKDETFPTFMGMEQLCSLQ